ncbi:MAG: hypothetical protein ACYTG0_18525 [Planctomycetota bacterium]|jgi:hypothetical protein
MSHRTIQIAELRRVHELTTQRFPHEYLDTGLGAIGLFLHEPPKNAGYRSTPLNSVTFASIGVDGIHFGSITGELVVDPSSPVVLTIPMAFEAPNYIVGSSLYDFLCLGCRHGYSNLGNLHLDFDGTMEYYQNEPGDFFDERSPGILQTMSDELSLKPWGDVRGHFLDLQSRFMSLLRLPTET